MCHLRLYLEGRFFYRLLALRLALVVLCGTLILLHRHALTILSLFILEAPRPMAVLRGRRLLEAVTVLVGHLGGGPRPASRRGLDTGNRW